MRRFLALIVILIIFASSCYAKDSIWGKDIELDACSNERTSPLILSCIIDISDKRQEEYEEQFNKYIATATKNKEYLGNFLTFLKQVKKAKSSWDIYVKNECLSETAGSEGEDSAGYQTAYSMCLIERYNQRIKYYKQQEEQHSL